MLKDKLEKLRPILNKIIAGFKVIFRHYKKLFYFYYFNYRVFDL